MQPDDDDDDGDDPGVEGILFGLFAGWLLLSMVHYRRPFEAMCQQRRYTRTPERRRMARRGSRRGNEPGASHLQALYSTPKSTNREPSSSYPPKPLRLSYASILNTHRHHTPQVQAKCGYLVVSSPIRADDDDAGQRRKRVSLRMFVVRSKNFTLLAAATTLTQ